MSAKVCTDLPGRKRTVSSRLTGKRCGSEGLGAAALGPGSRTLPVSATSWGERLGHGWAALTLCRSMSSAGEAQRGHTAWSPQPQHVPRHYWGGAQPTRADPHLCARLGVTWLKPQEPSPAPLGTGPNTPKTCCVSEQLQTELGRGSGSRGPRSKASPPLRPLPSTSAGGQGPTQRVFKNQRAWTSGHAGSRPGQQVEDKASAARHHRLLTRPGKPLSLGLRLVALSPCWQVTSMEMLTLVHKANTGASQRLRSVHGALHTHFSFNAHKHPGGILVPFSIYREGN